MVADSLHEAMQQRAVQAGDFIAQFGSGGKAVAQRGKVTRTRRTQRDARQDAFEIAHATQALTQAAMATLVDEAADGLVTAAQYGTIAQRAIEPATQQARAHRRHRFVEHAEQGVVDIAALVRVDFQVAPRGGVHRDGFARVLHGQAGEMRQRALLGFLDIAEQAAGGRHGQRQAFHAEAEQVARTEETAQLARGGIAIEMPGLALAHAGQRADQLRPCHVLADQGLCRLQARQFGGEALG